ncbi:MAG: hypothetical protein MR822_05565 [Bacteroidales bacterium]|nr:hypothetical protein [Bacteroidales bacterium]
MRKVIRSIHNLVVDIIACLMKLAVIISLPVVFIYYICHPRITANKR